MQENEFLRWETELAADRRVPYLISLHVGKKSLQIQKLAKGEELSTHVLVFHLQQFLQKKWKVFKNVTLLPTFPLKWYTLFYGFFQLYVDRFRGSPG